MSYNKKTNLYEGYIYCITNTVNNKKYIGQTYRTIEERWNGHIKTSKYNKSKQILYTAFKKYGIDNFKIQEINRYSASTKEKLIDMLNKAEINEISIQNTIKPNGYNMASGGNRLPNTFTEVRVYQFDLFGNLLSKYDSISEASRVTGIFQSDISKCCNGSINHTGKYIWSKDKHIDKDEIKTKVTPVDIYDNQLNFIGTCYSMKEAKKTYNIPAVSEICSTYHLGNKNKYLVFHHGEDIDKNKYFEFLKLHPSVLGVYQYDNDMNLLNTYDSVLEASSDLGIDCSSLSKSCKSNIGKYKGFIWKYVSEIYMKGGELIHG